MKLYGIPNCDTVRQARAHLSAHGVSYEFHDFKKHGVSAALLASWLRQVGWQKLLKKTGPTWGKLPAEVKEGIHDDDSALALMLAQPNVIRRPVLEQDGTVVALGFDQDTYTRLFP